MSVENSNRMLGPPFVKVPSNIGRIRTPTLTLPEGDSKTPDLIPPHGSQSSNLFLEYLHQYRTVSYDSNGAVIALKMSFERYIIRSEMLRGSREKACKQTSATSVSRPPERVWE